MKDITKAADHLRNHQTYPASKEDLVRECDSLSDFSTEDKKWFEEHLPEGVYNSAEDVMMALGWSRQEMDQPYQTA